LTGSPLSRVRPSPVPLLIPIEPRGDGGGELPPRAVQGANENSRKRLSAQKACGKSNVRAHALPASVGDNGRWIARGELGWCLQAVAQVVRKMPRAPRANRITHRITA
jgi:hypothetical protein